MLILEPIQKLQADGTNGEVRRGYAVVTDTYI